MKRLIEYSAAHYIAVLVFILGITVFAALFLPRLYIDITPEGLMAADTPERAFFESIQAEYGDDNISLIIIRDDEIQDPENLKKIARLVNQLYSLEFVRYVESLYSARYIKVVNDSVISQPFLDPLPKTPEESAQIFKQAIGNPLVGRNLISDDGRTLALNIYLDDLSLGDNRDVYITQAIDNVLQYYDAEFEEVYQFGLPYVRSVLEKDIFDEQVLLIPQAFLVLIVVLLIVLRNLNAGLVPVLTSMVSIIWLLGVMALLDIPLTLITAIVPILLIIIGSTEDVHLISEYLLAKKAGKDRSAAIKTMAYRKGFASLMTFVTSWFGFASVALNPLEVLRDFSIVASCGLLFNYLITMMLVPAWLCLFGSRKSRRLETGRALKLLTPALNLICYIVRKRKTATLVILAGVTIVFLYGSSQIRLNNNIMSYFDDDAPIKVRYRDVAQELAGVETLMVVLDAGIEDTFLHSKYLEQLNDLARYIESIENVDKASSFADYIAIMNSAVNDTGAIELPDDNFVLSELSIFIDKDEVRPYIDQDFTRAVIRVRHHIGSSYVFNQAMESIQAYMDEHIDPSIEVRITGDSYLINKAADDMVSAQGKSLMLILFIIFVVISLIFVNIQAGLLSIIPNVFPIVVMFGVMGFTGIPLDTSTAMIAAIALGVIIDDTMHFMVRYNQELNDIYEEESAIAKTIRAEALPIMSTSVALALGFLVMTQSDFLPFIYFGALSALVIVVALVSEFILTPILLSSLRLVTMWDMMSLPLKDQLLKRCRLFDGMRPWQVRKLILLSRLHHYKRGDVIMREGDPATEMYILLDGAVDITVQEEQGERVIKNTADTGRLFGMMRVSGEDKRGTSAIATENSEVLVISWQSIERVARFYPRISSLFFKNLSGILGARLLEHIQARPADLQ